MTVSSKKPPVEDIDFLSDENEIREMENWLKTQEGLDFEVCTLLLYNREVILDEFTINFCYRVLFLKKEMNMNKMLSKEKS